MLTPDSQRFKDPTPLTASSGLHLPLFCILLLTIYRIIYKEILSPSEDVQDVQGFRDPLPSGISFNLLKPTLHLPFFFENPHPNCVSFYFWWRPNRKNILLTSLQQVPVNPEITEAASSGKNNLLDGVWIKPGTAASPEPLLSHSNRIICWGSSTDHQLEHFVLCLIHEAKSDASLALKYPWDMPWNPISSPGVDAHNSADTNSRRVQLSSCFQHKY